MTLVCGALQLLKNSLTRQTEGFLMSGASCCFWSQSRPSRAGLV